MIDRNISQAQTQYNTIIGVLRSIPFFITAMLFWALLWQLVYPTNFIILFFTIVASATGVHMCHEIYTIILREQRYNEMQLKT